MNILMTGGTGLIGRALQPVLLNAGHRLILLTRFPEKYRTHATPYRQYLASLDAREHLNDIDAVINLAGEPIADHRWSPRQKTQLCESRWKITEKLAKLINASIAPPSVLISGSAVGYYGDQGNHPVTEQAPSGHGFTSHLCRIWEANALHARSNQTRVCLLRTGGVLSAKGGILTKMRYPFLLGLGGPIGDGRQCLPWIHIDDAVRAIQWLLVNPLNGPYNLVAPHPISNALFSQTLATRLHRKAWLRIPVSAMRLIMGEAATLVLDSQQVRPQQLLDSGFTFRWPVLEAALADLIP